MLDQLPATVLQMCSETGDFSNLLEYLIEFKFISGAACPFIDRLGLPLLGMIVYAAVSVPIYLTTNSVTIPVVLLLLTGGATVSQMAGPATALGAIVLLVTGAGAITYLYYSYSPA